jgi:hydrogenase/urease accessory protein HupE
MNTDLALVLMGCTGAIFGFLVGYAKGHEHGKIQGKINARRILKSQVSR